MDLLRKRRFILNESPNCVKTLLPQNAWRRRSAGEFEGKIRLLIVDC